MSAIFFNADEMFGYLTRLAEKDNYIFPIDIASYGMYLGITEDGKDWSDKFPSSARDFINVVAKRSHRIVIGLPFFMECVEGCGACALQYDKRLFRTAVTADKLGLNVRYAQNCHLKYYKVENKLVIGGMNLSQSGWTDISVVTNSTIRTRAMYRKLWRSSNPDISKFFVSKEVKEVQNELPKIKNN